MTDDVEMRGNPIEGIELAAAEGAIAGTIQATFTTILESKRDAAADAVGKQIEQAMQEMASTALLAMPEKDLELGRKDCRGDPSKLRFDLVPPEAEEAMAAVLTYGAGKYGARNWEKGIPWGELYGAVRRHMLAWMGGEDLDESGLPHLWHAFTSLGMLLTMVQRRPDLDTARNFRKDEV